MEASFNTWTVIFLLAALHGLVLGGLVWRRNGTRSSRYMAVFLLLFSVTLATYVAYWTGYQRVYPHLMGLAEPLYFLFGPLLYGYMLTTLYPETSVSRRHLAHLLPFALYLAWMAPFFLLPAPEKLDYAREMASGESSAWRLVPVTAKVLHLGGYLAASLWLLRRRFGEVRSEEVADFARLRQRLYVIAGCFGGFIFCYSLYFVLVYTIDFNVEYDYMISGAMTVFIYAVGYLGYWNGSSAEEWRTVRKYETSTLDREDLDEQLQRLQAYMRRERPWKDGELRLGDLAEALDLAPHHLSQIINDGLEMNFFEFVNRYRVEEAEKMLADPSNRELTILHIAYEAGFNNKTSFNKAFKENAGKTPSQFKKEHINGYSA